MKKYVLFSPIGMTDPISNGHDGALIHICRIYKPEKIYLYISKEINDLMEFDKKDYPMDRFKYALLKLKELLGYSFESIIIDRPDLVEVQKFDDFYLDFKTLLSDIQTSNHECDILLNVSSGTPAMKGALQTIAAFSQEYIPIQVSTPEKASNPKKFDIKEYDQEMEWELNIDNTLPIKCRAEVSSNLNLSVIIKKEILTKHLDVYDYNASFSIAQEIQEHLPKDSLQLIEIAKYRVQLNKKEIDKLKSSSDLGLFPIEHGKERDVFEYILWLQMKQQRGELADFIRGITPIFVDLLELILEKKKASFDIKEYCRTQRNNATGKVEITNKLDIKKLESNDAGILVLKALNEYQEYYGGLKDGVTYSSAHLAEIIRTLYKNDSNLISIVDRIRKVETKVRNLAAHEIVCVSEDWVQQKSNLSTAKILTLLISITKYAITGLNQEDWGSYNKMNELIKAKLYEQE